MLSYIAMLLPNLDLVIFTKLFQSCCLSSWFCFMEYLLKIFADSGSELQQGPTWNLETPTCLSHCCIHCTAHLHSLFNQVLQHSYISSSAQQRNVLLTLSEQSSSTPLSSATPQLATTSWLELNQKLHRS